jgi:hypothetical protein
MRMREKRVDPRPIIVVDIDKPRGFFVSFRARSDSCTSVGSKARCFSSCLHNPATRVLTSNMPIVSTYIEHP